MNLFKRIREHNKANTDYFAREADNRLAKLMEMEEDEYCLNCGSNKDLTDKICWTCLTAMEAEKS